ncbi:metallophosphoesterase family protein [Palleronia pelagia]|uniref:3',5'-cyclic AMP phosphodiesterase CpdA n=1 Tax=Palleronia pelagia TaxID=387096 RepID=A0A1H8J7Q3_9RHOB|nr:metallophosphoesterase family protein [Palleronia pelagia]SEN76810.1 3',5'-cyclic AMP phosphodiesterase CpdA [Palleronia pelagia]
MTRIVHLSDLHFGRDRAEAEPQLVEIVNDLAPDLVAVSGDFTQRARRGQFERASAFLEKLTPPILSVPGNHDTPLDNLWVRLLRPWSRYRHAIDRKLEPMQRLPGAVIQGVNTVNRFSWQRGRISERTVAKVCDAFEDAGDRLRIVVLHHPLEHGPEVEKRLMRGARAALGRLQECGADVVLSGHLHHTITAPFQTAQGLLFVQAGTGLSTRLRGEPNTFNLVQGDRDGLQVQTFAATPGTGFALSREASFFRVSGKWTAPEGD